MNDCKFSGRLTRNPKDFTKGETTIAGFTIAVGTGKKDENGKEICDFPFIKCFGRLADNLLKYKKQGDFVNVSARYKTGSFVKNGETVYTNDLIAYEVEFVSNSNKSSEDFSNAECSENRTIDDLKNFKEVHFTDIQPDEDDGELPF